MNLQAKIQKAKTVSIQRETMDVTSNLNQACPECHSLSRVYTIKMIPTNRPLSEPKPQWFLPYPKYVPQIKESCYKCRNFIKFYPQHQKLIEVFNRKLKGIELVVLDKEAA